MRPYDALFQPHEARSSRERIDEALSRILNLLVDRLLVFSSKHLAHGCCEALSSLSQTYLTTVYAKAWDCLMPAGRQAKKPVKKTVARGDAVDSSPGMEIYHLFCSKYLLFFILC